MGLTSDGFNPFREIGNSCSTSRLVVIAYNLPLTMCMKPANMILSLLIDGPHEPSNRIDTYLQLLIDELKELWDNGVDTYDASKKVIFKLCALLLWTINDFPAYVMLLG